MIRNENAREREKVKAMQGGACGRSERRENVEETQKNARGMERSAQRETGAHARACVRALCAWFVRAARS